MVHESHAHLNRESLSNATAKCTYRLSSNAIAWIQQNGGAPFLQRTVAQGVESVEINRVFPGAGRLLQHSITLPLTLAQRLREKGAAMGGASACLRAIIARAMKAEVAEPEIVSATPTSAPSSSTTVPEQRPSEEDASLSEASRIEKELYMMARQIKRSGAYNVQSWERTLPKMLEAKTSIDEIEDIRKIHVAREEVTYLMRQRLPSLLHRLEALVTPEKHLEIDAAFTLDAKPPKYPKNEEEEDACGCGHIQEAHDNWNRKCEAHDCDCKKLSLVSVSVVASRESERPMQPDVAPAFHSSNGHQGDSASVLGERAGLRFYDSNGYAEISRDCFKMRRLTNRESFDSYLSGTVIE